MIPLNVAPERLRYKALIGTGGIGSGTFFALEGEHTMGREETRMGRFLDRKDYCKLHIIAHYVKTLMGEPFQVFPIGAVGEDPEGLRLIGEMKAVGLDLRHVKILTGEQTLHCICLIYPDGGGGNLTVNDSASAHVTAIDVHSADGLLSSLGPKAIALAVPEVPFNTRVELLRLATRHGCLRVVSFVSEEMSRIREEGLLSHVDILSMNMDEAAALIGVPTGASPTDIIGNVADFVHTRQPNMLMAITAGGRGSWVGNCESLVHKPAFAVNSVCTAGAGDAFLSGLLAGLAAGLDIHEAHDLAALTGAFSVTSPHTIHPELDAAGLKRFVDEQSLEIDPVVIAVLGEIR